MNICALDGATLRSQMFTSSLTLGGATEQPGGFLGYSIQPRFQIDCSVQMIFLCIFVQMTLILIQTAS